MESSQNPASKAAYQEALSRIRACKKENTLDLHLGIRNLDTIPLDIQELTQLRALFLNNTSISDVSGLAPLTQLQ